MHIHTHNIITITRNNTYTYIRQQQAPQLKVFKTQLIPPHIHTFHKTKNMENYSHESISPLSDTLYTNEQYPDLGISNKPQNPLKKHDSWSKTKKKNEFFLQGYVEDDLVRSKSLTDEDLDELKGCFDLGFGGFSYDEIPELCNTLPALELCYSMSQKFLDEQQKNEEEVVVVSPPAHGPIANWKISSPGDSPEEVKARLKYWAQAVACTVRLCN